MPIGIIFWVLMIFWIVCGFGYWRGIGGPAYTPGLLGGFGLFLFILLFLLGWHSFGFIVQG